jgi:hypothetical protein
MTASLVVTADIVAQNRRPEPHPGRSAHRFRRAGRRRAARAHPRVHLRWIPDDSGGGARPHG